METRFATKRDGGVEQLLKFVHAPKRSGLRRVLTLHEDTKENLVLKIQTSWV